jgi:hypothetical protein
LFFNIVRFTWDSYFNDGDDESTQERLDLEELDLLAADKAVVAAVAPVVLLDETFAMGRLGGINRGLVHHDSLLCSGFPFETDQLCEKAPKLDV